MAAVQTTFNSIDSQIELLVSEVLVINQRKCFLLKFKRSLLQIFIKLFYFTESIIFRASI